MAPYNDVVSAVRDVLGLSIDEAIEEYHRAEEDYSQSPTLFHTVKLEQASNDLRELRQSVSFQIEAEVDAELAMHMSSTTPEQLGLDAHRILLEVMNEQGKSHSESTSGMTNPDPMGFSNILNPETSAVDSHIEDGGQNHTDVDIHRPIEPTQGSGTPKAKFSHCPYPECNWKTRTTGRTPYAIRSGMSRHIGNVHNKVRLPCRVPGCSKTSTPTLAAAAIMRGPSTTRTKSSIETVVGSRDVVNPSRASQNSKITNTLCIPSFCRCRRRMFISVVNRSWVRVIVVAR